MVEAEENAVPDVAQQQARPVPEAAATAPAATEAEAARERVEPDAGALTRAPAPPADFDLAAAERAYSGTSHQPRRAAEVEKGQFEDYMANVEKSLRADAAEGADMDAAIGRIRQAYLSNRQRVFSVREGAVSPLVAGGSKFNSKQAGKRSDAVDRAEARFSEAMKLAVAREEQALGVSAAREAKQAAKAAEREEGIRQADLAAKQKRAAEIKLPIINEPGDAHPITSEEWSKTPKDYKSVSVGDGYRYRSMMVNGSLVPVYLTDKKVVEKPAIRQAESGRGDKAENYLKKFREEKARRVQPGGRPIPHVPHNVVGKPEGLSGSQVESSSLKNNVAQEEQERKQAEAVPDKTGDVASGAALDGMPLAGNTTAESGETDPLSAHEALMDGLRSGKVSLAEYKTAFAATLERMEEIEDAFSAMTKEAIFKRMGPHFRMVHRNDKKGELASAAAEDILGDFTIGRGLIISFASDFRAASRRALVALVEGTTEKDLQDFAGQDKKAQAFRDWLDGVGGTSEKLADGTFLDPSLPVTTGVSARMVVIDRASAPEGPSLKIVVADAVDTPAGAAGKAGGVSLAAVRLAVARFEKKFGQAVSIIPCSTFDAVPADVRAAVERKFGADANPKAIEHGASIYLIADKHRSLADIEESILHEIQHSATHLFFGSELEAKLNALFDAVGGFSGMAELARKRKKTAAGKAAAENYLKDYAWLVDADIDATREQKIQYLMDELLSLYGEAPRFGDRIKAVIGALRQWLREQGFVRLTKYGETDLLHIVSQSRRGLAGGGAGPLGGDVSLRAGGAARYSVSPQVLTGDSGLGAVVVEPLGALPYSREMLGRDVREVSVKGGNAFVLRRIAKAWGKTLVFFREDDWGGDHAAAGNDSAAGGHGSTGAGGRTRQGDRAARRVSGFVRPSVPDKIYLNVDSPNHMLFVLGHELGHTLRAQDEALWQRTVDELTPLLKNWSDYRERLNDARYARLSEPEQMEELVGDVFGDQFLTEAFWEDFARQSPSLFSRVARKAIALLTKALRLVAGRDVERYVTDLEQARAVVAKALIAYGENVAAGVYQPHVDLYDRVKVDGRFDGQALLNLLDSVGWSRDRGASAMGAVRMSVENDADILATLVVDGLERPTNNSKGRPIHATEEGTRNFWRWFDRTGAAQRGRDVVRQRGLAAQDGAGQDDAGDHGAAVGVAGAAEVGINGSGQPIVYYHGTKDDFSAFDLEHGNRKDHGWLGRGVYLTDTAAANSYANNKRGDGLANVMPVYAAVHHPYRVDVGLKSRFKTATAAEVARFSAALQRAGHDGVLLAGNGAVELVVFEPNQTVTAGGPSVPRARGDEPPRRSSLSG
ncbi:hypothetical protein [Desulfuromonas thiophila]|uniref:ADP-ribosyltransferase-containing protein n=1 Tax=Desulfuromonas thiophila TaxID=57664 RepID=UPI0029F4F134|nr:hypothetical protein [Desulfuromonas thiophila]